MKALFICYSRCSTCQKAKRWLEANGIDYEMRDVVAANPTIEELKLWHSQSGLPLRKMFNTSGQKYRELNLKERLVALGDDAMLDLLASDGMLVRRPLLVKGSTVLVGFRQAEWEAALL